MIAAAATHVLVIEDNAMNADVLRENLEEAGFRFALAVNGASGVAVANDTLPDIILMDVNLPILDGLAEATRLTSSSSLAGGSDGACIPRPFRGSRDAPRGSPGRRQALRLPGSRHGHSSAGYRRWARSPGGRT